MRPWAEEVNPAADGARAAAVPIGTAAERQELAREITGFIESVWMSVFGVPLTRIDPPTIPPTRGCLFEEALLSGFRAVRLTCETPLCHWMSFRVFGYRSHELDDVGAHESLLEVARAIGSHVQVIEHPAWPWTSELGHATRVRSIACELWFSCRGSVLQVALSHPEAGPP